MAGLPLLREALAARTASDYGHRADPVTDGTGNASRAVEVSRDADRRATTPRLVRVEGCGLSQRIAPQAIVTQRPYAAGPTVPAAAERTAVPHAAEHPSVGLRQKLALGRPG